MTEQASLPHRQQTHNRKVQRGTGATQPRPLLPGQRLQPRPQNGFQVTPLPRSQLDPGRGAHPPPKPLPLALHQADSPLRRQTEPRASHPAARAWRGPDSPHHSQRLARAQVCAKCACPARSDACLRSVLRLISELEGPSAVGVSPARCGLGRGNLHRAREQPGSRAVARRGTGLSQAQSLWGGGSPTATRPLCSSPRAAGPGRGCRADMPMSQGGGSCQKQAFWVSSPTKLSRRNTGAAHLWDQTEAAPSLC